MNEILDETWFAGHIKEIKDMAGPRYTAKLNVSLPISEIFNGLDRSSSFYDLIRSNYGELMKEFKYVNNSKHEDADIQKKFLLITEQMKKLFLTLDKIKEYDTSDLPWEEVEATTTTIKEDLQIIINELRSYKEKISEEKSKTSSVSGYDKYSSDIHHFSRIEEKIRYFNRLSTSKKAFLSNNPLLLLSGSAGNGKTHLLCDLVEGKISKKTNLRPGVILFGQSFSETENFEESILRQLNLLSNYNNIDSLLEDLNKIGEQEKSRFLIIIDALNEAESREIWKRNIPNLIEKIKSYRHVAIILSIRNGYEHDLLSKEILEELVSVEHSGFSGDVVWNAVNSYFSHYNISLPEMPILHPEFYNPLFLKFFCEKNKNSKPDIKGGNSLKDIFEDFVIEIGLEVLKNFIPNAEKRGSDGRNILWDGIVKDAALWMAQNGQNRISTEELKKIVSPYFSGKEQEVINLLERRVLLQKFDWENQPSYGFTYNKFSDHIIVRSLLTSVATKKEREEGFKEGGKIAEILIKFKYNYGILEALCIQVPEFFKKKDKKELFEIAPYLGDLSEPMKESLVWRNSSTINEKIINLVERDLLEKSDFFLEPILSLASFPEHPLNAQFLSSILYKQSLGERDTWWSTFLHYQYNEHGAVDRLLDWAWSDYNKSYINDDSIFLTSITLAWFLTTPNRYIRDRATKGLVSLLERKLSVLIKLLKEFENVNDPYITDRLYAVAYGCVMRNKDNLPDLKLLADFVYKKQFSSRKPTLHVLVRDYARGIIEVAENRNLKINSEGISLLPPFLSDWPDNIPTPDELEMQSPLKEIDVNTEENRGLLTIKWSVMGGGDFDRYIIGTNSWSSEWSGRKINEATVNRKEIYSNFEKTLTPNQRELLGKATNPYYGIDFSKIMHSMWKEEVEETTQEPKPEEDFLANQKEDKEEAFTKFESSLSDPDKNFFHREILPFLNDGGDINDPLETFNLKLMQSWIFTRTIELGYSSELHSKFDGRVNRYDRSGRSDHKSERIGKKYQWIAYHEFLALLSDHFEFKGAVWNTDTTEKYTYNGPWTPYVRDIDPSLIIQTDKHIKESLKLDKWYSEGYFYDAWEEDKTDEEWIASEKELPNPLSLIEILDDSGTEWLNLESLIVWQKKLPPEYKSYEIPTRDIFYKIKSFIIKSEDKEKIITWLDTKGFGNWLPESNDLYEAYLGEYPDSMAFEKLRGDHNTWVDSVSGIDLPAAVTVSDDIYLNEFTLDCSHEGSINVKLPCKWLVDNMNLNHAHVDGRFFDKDNNLICLSSSIFESDTRSVLLFNKQKLIRFLNENGYTIFWTILGEKKIVGGDRNFAPEGWTEITGLYSLENTNVEGSLKVNHKAAR